MDAITLHTKHKV